MTREQRVAGLVNDAGFSRDPFLKEFGVTLSNRMVELSGRVLPPTRLQYNPNNQRMVSLILRFFSQGGYCKGQIISHFRGCRIYFKDFSLGNTFYLHRTHFYATISYSTLRGYTKISGH